MGVIVSHIPLINTSILARKVRHMDCLIQEAAEIGLHLIIMNQQDGLYLSMLWKSLIHFLKEMKYRFFSKDRIFPSL
jgi:hypothetical protein